MALTNISNEAMNMKTKLFVLALACLAVTGCNMGMAPSGGSPAEVEANFKKMDPKEQIRIIKGSPASPEKKAQLIKDIEDKTGYKDNSGELVGGGTQSNAPATPGNAPATPGTTGGQ